ncbi:hypothetical protein DAI22_06g166100 [Oryza sativa Japonica Group]|nr:hypothetical protein DAI22_06g166100 [Oryza sativa Japonica Group]
MEGDSTVMHQQTIVKPGKKAAWSWPVKLQMDAMSYNYNCQDRVQAAHRVSDSEETEGLRPLGTSQMFLVNVYCKVYRSI